MMRKVLRIGSRLQNKKTVGQKHSQNLDLDQISMAGLLLASHGVRNVVIDPIPERLAKN